MFGRIDPDALIVDQGAGAHGLKDGVGGGLDVFRVVNDVGGGVAHVLLAFSVEAGGVDVAIECASLREVVVADDIVGAVPVQEVGFDVFAVFVLADDALAAVALE